MRNLGCSGISESMAALKLCRQLGQVIVCSAGLILEWFDSFPSPFA